jgi:hypothetical protein
MPQSQKRRRDGERATIKMLGGYSMRFDKVLSNGEERWRCSRNTLGADAAGETRYCQGSARKFPWQEALTLHTVHSPWCHPKPDDEEVGLSTLGAMPFPLFSPLPHFRSAPSTTGSTTSQR